MTTNDELNEILKKKDKENLKNELKQSLILRTKEGQRNLAYEIVAFANKFGGKLILGIKDDGNFEGKDIFNVDLDKQLIDNICQDKISPVIECSTEFLQNDKGDVLIINIPKRKNIPHAYIVSRTGPEIKSRIYYIRTSHGKRLVRDGQLYWLFKYEDNPNFSYNFKIVLNFSRDPFQILIQDEQPRYVFDYDISLAEINEKVQTMIYEKNENLFPLFIEITPYAFINSFSKVFSHSWLSIIRRDKGSTGYGPLDTSVKKLRISIDNIPLPPKNSILESLSWNIKEIYYPLSIFGFYVPPDTELKIKFDNKGNKSQLILKNEIIELTFIFRFSRYSKGLDFFHPSRMAITDDNLLKQFETQESLMEKYSNIGLSCEFQAIYDFSEADVETIKNYNLYVETIMDLLQNEWNYDYYLSTLPNYKFYAIQNKLNDIEKKIENLNLKVDSILSK